MYHCPVLLPKYIYYKNLLNLCIILSFWGGGEVNSIKFILIAGTYLNNMNFNETFAAEYIIHLLSLFKGKESLKQSLWFYECAPRILNLVTSFIEFGMDVMSLDATAWFWKFVQ
jgi:hypothetical protein